MKKTLFISAIALFLVVALGMAEQYYRLYVRNLISKDGQSHLLYVGPDTSFDSLMISIAEHYEFASEFSFHLHSRLMHFNHPRTGCYMLGAEEGDLAVIRRLRNGEQTPLKVTFNQVRTRRQLAERLATQLMLDTMDILGRLEDDSYMECYGLNTATAVALFIPDTYELYWTISPDALFERMNAEYNRFWNTERRAKAQKWNLSPVEVAVLASIVEEETNKAFEYPIIASLYYNRLQKGMPLQACPTVKFAWQDFTLRRILLRHLAIESPYNTYRNKGLPPGPIRIPRGTTIDAVLNMTPTTYLFMCASPDFNGTHRFSSTYAEHARNARQYQAELNKRNIK